MYSQYKVSGYNITTDPSFQNETFGNTDELIAQFNELFLEAQNKKNKKIIGRLTELILQHPRSPQLKNFLSVAYIVQGNGKKATEVNRWILSEHPDYLFAKLNLANEYITAGQPHKVPEVLGADMEIKALYPTRDLFHLAEVSGFYKVAIRYYAAIKNLELAENRLEVLKEIAPGHPDTYSAEAYLFPLRINKGLELRNEEEASSIQVKCAIPVPTSNQNTAPVFSHSAIHNLYKYGIGIPHEILKEILALPRETVIADLENVLKDAVARYPYFIKTDLQEESENFPLHAICLLAELKSENSLAAILNFLENNEEVLEYLLGDHFTETIWMPLYLLSQGNLPLLKQFLLKPGIYTYSKTAVSEALAQIALHQPEKRNEIATVYKDVFSYNLNAGLNDNIIDSDFLALSIGNCIDCGFSELLPLIKELFAKKYVDLGVNGIYDDVEKSFKNPSPGDFKNEVQNIFELYENILTTWAGYNEEEGYLNEDYFGADAIQQSDVSNKIGRNDPCPCGSGKKFKKCCIDKLPL